MIFKTNKHCIAH